MFRNLVLSTFVLILISSCTDDKSQPVSNVTKANEPARQDTVAVQTAPASIVRYEVIWENDTKRYDHAPTILVITDSNSHNRMHGLVDQFARQKSSKKFTLIVLDDKKAGLVYKASHYGANEVNRIATKAELKLMDKHIVGTYIGELEANGDPYEIMYHGFGFEKESHEEYEPNL
jgi:hypothetical protein